MINKYKVKQLEIAFKRSASIIANALNLTADEFGYGTFKDLNSICGNLPETETYSCHSDNISYFQDINEFFLSRFNKITELDQYSLNNKKIYVLNYSGKSSELYGNLYGITYFNTPYAALYHLSDGTVISSLTFFYHGKYDGVTLTFDTNGPQKGPNRNGYDIFLYTTGSWNKICSKNKDDGNYNGRGCYDYAIQDVNPDDKSKGYWEALY